MRSGNIQRIGASLIAIAAALLAYVAYSHRAEYSLEALLWIGAAVLGGWTLAFAAIGAYRFRPRPAPTQAAVPGGLEGISGRPRKEYIVPAELPPPPTVLMGRDAQIERVCRVLQQASQDGPRVVVLSGAAGIGRSALAVSVADLMADSYPDGQLLVDADSRPGMRTEEVLAAFYWALKKPGEHPEPANLERWYRNRTAKKRVLVILDNFADPEEIRRLLPAGEKCAVVVTSAAPIPGLAAHAQLTLEPLNVPCATQTLLALIGLDAPLPPAEASAARRIIDATAGYPVALHVAGAALSGRKNWTLQLAVRRMDEAAALRDAGAVDLPVFVGALDLSFAMLTQQERRGLAALGLLPGADTDPLEDLASWMLAALLRGLGAESREESVATARRLLDRFSHARLAQRRFDDGSGVVTFRIPEYVRAYARAQQGHLIQATERAAAEQALAAERTLRGERKPDDLLARTVYRMLDQGRLAAALDAAREAVAFSRELRRRGSPPVAAREGLSLAALAEVYAELGWIEEGVAYAEAALKAGDDADGSEPRARRVLGQLRSRQRLFPGALDQLDRAAGAARAIRDGKEHIRVLRERAVTRALAGQPTAALADADRALDLCAKAGTSGNRLRSGALWARGAVLLAADDLDQAAAVLRHADELSGPYRLDQRLWRAWILHQRGLVALAAGRHEEGRKFGFRSLDGFTALRHRYGAGHSRLVIGRAYLAEGRVAAAVPMLEETLVTFRASGDRWIEAEASTVLAEAQQLAYRSEPSPRTPPLVRQLLLAAEQTFARLGDLDGEERSRRLLAGLDGMEPAAARESPPAARWSAATTLPAILAVASRTQG